MGCGEPIATDERAVVAESLLDSTIVQNSQDDRCLANSARPSQSNWCEVFCEIDNRLDQLAASEEELRWRRR